jgi:hypothetical protein
MTVLPEWQNRTIKWDKVAKWQGGKVAKWQSGKVVKRLASAYTLGYDE